MPLFRVGIQYTKIHSLDVGGVNSPHKLIGITRSTIGAGILANSITIRRDPISIEDQYPDLFGQPDCNSLQKQEGRNALDSSTQGCSGIMASGSISSRKQNTDADKGSRRLDASNWKLKRQVFLTLAQIYDPRQ